MTYASPDGVDDVNVIPAVLAHYERAGPLLERNFANEPIVFANFPGGFSEPPHYHVTEVPLSERRLLWEVHCAFAIEFHSWAPLVEDEDRLHFARLLFERTGATPLARVREAALAIREYLHAESVDAVPLLDAHGGIALCRTACAARSTSPSSRPSPGPISPPGTTRTPRPPPPSPRASPPSAICSAPK